MAVTCRRIFAIKHLQGSFSVGVATNQIWTGMDWSFDPNHSIFEPKQARRAAISFVSAKPLLKALGSETNLLHQQLVMFSSLQLWQLRLQLLEQPFGQGLRAVGTAYLPKHQHHRRHQSQSG